jgi:multimeric flavodoxin WrbA
MKILAVCGSPRKGNTEFMLGIILNEIKNHEKEMILLREKIIKHCTGCLSCNITHKCVVDDSMQEIYPKIREANLIVIATPNYFDNVSGLLKDFIDRTNPFYETDELKGKKLFALVVGGGKKKNSKRVIKQALTYFSKAHDYEFVDSLCVEALNPDDVKNNEIIVNKLKKLGQKINNM